MATFNLTTTFTPPSECLTDIYRYNDNQLVGPMTSACYPQGWTNTSTTFYSPGICPSGYTTACITANTANTVTETIATCCPTNFECAKKGDLIGCISPIINGQTQLITVLAHDLSSISTTETEIIGGNMNAYGVQIRFQATDLAQVITTTSTASSSISSPSATPSQSSSTPTTTSTSTSTSPQKPTSTSSPALSPGAKAGIGVGVALAVCVGLVLLWFGWRHAKRRNTRSAHAGEATGTRNSEPRTKDSVKYSPVEADDQGIPEMQGTGLLPEVEGHHKVQRHELEGLGR